MRDRRKRFHVVQAWDAAKSSWSDVPGTVRGNHAEADELLRRFTSGNAWKPYGADRRYRLDDFDSDW